MRGRLFTEETYQKDDMQLTTRNSGKMVPKKFYRVWCDYCEREVFPTVLKKFSDYLGENATLVDLVSKWDTLLSKKNDGLTKYIDVIGCFLPNPPQDTRLLPGPNFRKFLERGYEHVGQAHPHTQPRKNSEAQNKKRQSGITQLILNTTSSTTTPPPKKLAVELSSSVKPGSSRQRTLTSKYGCKMKYMPIDHYVLGQRKSLLGKAKYPNEKLGKANCLMMVHQGVNKKISNEVIFDTYDVAMIGSENQYEFTKECFLNGALEVLQPPIRYALNKDTIYDCVGAITQAYKHSENSVYSKINNALFWGLSHDAIIKFGIDFLGVFIQVTDCDG